MKREKIVFILGNGFSIGMGFPDFSTLYDRCKTPVDDYTPLLSRDGYLDKFPFSYFDEQNIKNIEVLLSIWQAYIENYEDIVQDKSPLKSTYAYLVDYLKTMCGHLIKYGTGATKTNLFSNFTNMVREIIKDNDISFITLNYDLILERVAEKINIPVAYINNPTGTGLIVIKFHGSANWIISSGGICSQNGHKYPKIWEGHEKNTQLIISHIDDSCDWPMPYLSTSQPPVIITPTVSKKYEGIFRKILVSAENELNAADKVIVIGYSFPEFDLMPRYIIQESHKINYNKKWKKFLYINSNKQTCKKVKDMFDNECDVITKEWSTELILESLKGTVVV